MKRQSTFTASIRPLLHVMTVPGFRPFAVPGERWTFRQFSIVGLIFWLPVPFVTAFLLQFYTRMLVENTKIYGFFDPLTIYYVVGLIFFLFQFVYALIAPLSASKMYSCLTKLDSLSLLSPSYNRFLKVFHIAFPCCLIVLTAICTLEIWITLKTTEASGLALGAVPYWAYLALFEMVSCMILYALPLLLLMFMAYYLSLAFDANIEHLKSCPAHELEVELPKLYYSYLNLTKAVEMVDNFFAFITCGAVSINGVIICLFIMNLKNFTMLPIPLLVVQAMLILGNFFGYSIVCTLLNDKSREIRTYVYNVGPASPTIHQWLDFIQRITLDDGWGLTLGKLFILERTALLTIIGAMTTFLAFYAQFNDNDPAKAAFTGFDFKQIISDGK